MKKVYGDLIEMAEHGDFDVIVHGCNCFCTMGAGIALQIKHHFPEAYYADCDYSKKLQVNLGVMIRRYICFLVNQKLRHLQMN